jgi:hypothetical protein
LLSENDNKKRGKLEFPGPATNDRGLVLTNHEDMDVLIAKYEESPIAEAGTNLVRSKLPRHFESMKRTGFKFTDFQSSIPGESI